MVLLPTPKWLTLPEALAWLTGKGIEDSEATRNALHRAFHNNEIQTRGRGKKWFQHDTKAPLHGSAWDNAAINWEHNFLSRDGADGKGAIYLNDIDVNVDNMRAWLSIEGRQNQTPEVSPQQNGRRGATPKYDWDAFFQEIVVIADLDSLPMYQAELEKHMAQWCRENWGAEPSESTIRGKVSPIYKHSRRTTGKGQ